MEKSCYVAASGRGRAAESREQQRPALSGKKKMETRVPKTTQPKTTSFWGYCFFFFFKSEHPKMTLFWDACFFFFFLKDTSKTASF